MNADRAPQLKAGVRFTSMWPFKKKLVAPQEKPSTFAFTQLDTTEHFDDNQSLGGDGWITTVPLNTLVPDGENMGLPASVATDNQGYSVAWKMSKIRESLNVPNDGVYCPICHVAHIDLSRLRTPCPKCRRPLLRFGWD